jgi:hypothetical protein
MPTRSCNHARAELSPGPNAWPHLILDRAGSVDPSHGGVYFNGAGFTDGAVSFDSAEFSGGRVYFNGSQFSGAQVDFTSAADWSHPPTFDFEDARPPQGVKLPAACGTAQP